MMLRTGRQDPVKILRDIARSLFIASLLALLLQGCTVPWSRPWEVPQPARPPSRPPAPQAKSPAPGSAPATRPPAKPAVESGQVIEEDIRDKRPGPQAKLREPEPPRPSLSRQAPPQSLSVPETKLPGRPPVPEEGPLTAKIDPKTPPQRAASLRLTEEGKKLLAAGDPAKAVSRLEKGIAVDSTNPYGYYYLAQAHFALGRYQESLNFLDVAESRFSGDSYWLSEVYTLRGENHRALGDLDRADFTYTQALRLNPGNRLAAEGLSRVQAGNQAPIR